MTKAPSAATKLRTAMRNIKHLQEVRNTAMRDIKRLQEARNAAAAAREAYRARATKAEQEVAEWKARFDALLARTPKEECAKAHRRADRKRCRLPILQENDDD